jgi:hypothetical protein
MFVPERRTINKYKREPIRINDEHIKKVLSWITERDVRILKLLLTHPFLKTSQIEMMVFSDLKPSSWRTKCNERMRRLYHAHCVDRWYTPVGSGEGSSEAHYVLDNLGTKILAIKLGYKEEINKFRKRVYLPQTYKHSLKIFDFKAMLHVLNRQIGVIDGHTVGEILKWRTEHEATINYRSDGKKGQVIPDAFCIYKYTPTLVKPFFLECDNATMDLNQLKSKIRRYLDCYESGDWRETDWARLIKTFPPVIIVMHSFDDVRKLTAFIRTNKSNIRFLLTTYSDLITRNFKSYPNNHGKVREVLSDIKINLLEPIYVNPYEKGRAVL